MPEIKLSFNSSQLFKTQESDSTIDTRNQRIPSDHIPDRLLLEPTQNPQTIRSVGNLDSPNPITSKSNKSDDEKSPEPKYKNNNFNPEIEEAPADPSYLGETCRLWENSVAPVSAMGIRLVTLRIGIVLTPKGGALKEFLKPLQFRAAIS